MYTTYAFLMVAYLMVLLQVSPGGRPLSQQVRIISHVPVPLDGVHQHLSLVVFLVGVERLDLCVLVAVLQDGQLILTVRQTVERSFVPGSGCCS